MVSTDASTPSYLFSCTVYEACAAFSMTLLPQSSPLAILTRRINTDAQAHTPSTHPTQNTTSIRQQTQLDML